MADLGTLNGASPINASDDTRHSFTADLTETASFALDNTPADFATMDSLSWQVEYARANAGGDDQYDLAIRIVNGATILAAADSGGTFQTVATNITNTTDTTSSVTAFSYVNTTANKATWDGASIELQQVYTKTKGADVNNLTVDYVAITGAYTAGVPAQDITGAAYSDPDTLGAGTITTGPVDITGAAHSDPDTIGSGTVSQPTPYSSPLSEIDGNDYLTITQEHFVDGTDFTFVAYGDFNNAATATYLFHAWGRHEIRLFSTSSNQLNIQLRDTSNVLIVDWTSHGSFLPMSGPGLIYIHADTSATPSITVTLDGVAVSGTENTLTAGTMDHTRSDYGIFARYDGTDVAPGELAGYVYVSDHHEPESSFWDGSQVLEPPTNGEIVYTSADNFAANQGTGGSFTRTGTFPHAAAAQNITGAAHSDGDSFGSGTVSTGPVGITGTAHSDSDTIGAGAVSQPSPFTHVGSNTGSSSGQVIRSVPAGHQADDICFLYIVDGGQDSARTAPSGFNFIAELATGNDPLAVADRRLSVWWKRLTSSSEPDIVIADTGQAQYVVCEVWRGCKTTGTPFQILSDTNSGTGATATLGGGTTLSNGAPVLFAVATEIDAVGSQISSTWANADLTGLTESQNFQSAGDTGWSIYSGYGFDDAAGSVGNTTVTFTQSKDWVGVALALLDESAAAAQDITGAAHADPDTIGAGSVSTSYDIVGADHVDPDTIGAGSVTAGPVTITGAVFADGDVIGAGSVSPGPVTITGTLHADADSFGGGVLSQILSGAGHVDPDNFGAGTVTPGAVNVAGVAHADPDTIGSGTVTQDGGPQTIIGADHADADQFGAGTVTPGGVTLTGTLYVDPNQFGAGAVSQDGGTQAITGAAFADADVFGSGAIQPGPVSIGGGQHIDLDTFGAGLVAAGAVQITGLSLSDPDTIGGGSIQPGPVVIAGNIHVDLDAFGAGAVTGGLLGHSVPVHLSAGSRSTIVASGIASTLANSRITSTLGD